MSSREVRVNSKTSPPPPLPVFLTAGRLKIQIIPFHQIVYDGVDVPSFLDIKGRRFLVTERAAPESFGWFFQSIERKATPTRLDVGRLSYPIKMRCPMTGVSFHIPEGEGAIFITREPNPDEVGWVLCRAIHDAIQRQSEKVGAA